MATSLTQAAPGSSADSEVSGLDIPTGNAIRPGDTSSEVSRPLYFAKSALAPVVETTGAAVARDTSFRRANARFQFEAPAQVARLDRPTFRGSFQALQKWEGSVLSVGKESFAARLVDLSQPRTDEEAEFAIEEVPPSDRSLVAPGAVFYWQIGYFDAPGGQRRRMSEIRFRRLPAWNRKELEEARARAMDFAKLVQWE